MIGNWTPGALKPPGRAGRAGVMNPNVWVTFSKRWESPVSLSLGGARMSWIPKFTSYPPYGGPRNPRRITYMREGGSQGIMTRAKW